MPDPMTELGRRLAAARVEFDADGYGRFVTDYGTGTSPTAARRFPPLAPPEPEVDLAPLRRALVKVALFMAGWFVGVMSYAAVAEGWL